MTVEQKPRSSPPKYRVDYSEKYGRFLRAGKDLSAGEVILREEPVTIGPMTGDTTIMCFACFRSLPGKGSHYVCSRCNFAPLCGIACEEESRFHGRTECDMFRNSDLSSGNTGQVIGALLPLRLWIVKQTDTELWRKIGSMEGHTERRRNTPVWRDRELNVLNVIRRLRLIQDWDESTSEVLQHVCSILDVNAFEVRSPGGLDELLLRGLYLGASLMAHDCRGNTHLTVDDNFQLTVYASLPIKQDQPILFNYTSPLLGTLERQEHLREGKYFQCDCPMCKDPYSLGAHTSSVLCPRCRRGFLGIQNPLFPLPFAKGNKWQCDHCRLTFGARLIRATVNISRNLIDDIDESDVKALEALLLKLSGSLHRNHSLLLSLKQKILAAYRKEISSPSAQRNTIQRTLDLSRELYNVLDIVEPGISRLKGILLYEMHLPMTILANRAYAAKEISLTVLSSKLEEAASLLKKGLTMLLLEPPSTPEGRLAKKALQELKTLNRTISDVKSIAALETGGPPCSKQKSPTVAKT